MGLDGFGPHIVPLLKGDILTLISESSVLTPNAHQIMVPMFPGLEQPNDKQVML